MTVLLVLLLLLAIGVAGLVAHTQRSARWAERQVPMAGRRVSVPGGATHLVEAGPKDAPAVVLIHGLSGQLQHFTYAMVEDLARDFRVVAVDRPGCGYSERAGDDDAALATQARMIRAALAELGVARPVLVGHSLGGTVALAMALDAPEGTGALALIAPLTRTQEATPAVFRGLEVHTPLMRRVIGHTLAVPLAWRTAERVLTAVFAPDRVPEDFVTRAGGALGLRPHAFVAASADLLAVQRDIGPLSARYGDLAMPRGVLFGDADALLPPERHGAAMAEHGFEVEMLEGRGHMLPITAPAACTALVRRLAAQV